MYTYVFKKIRRCFIIKEVNEQQINEEIRDKEVRLVDTEGEQLGIMSAKEAQKLANAKNLDLVKIAPKANPPVCKIMDYGKYKYELAKKEKEAKKNQKVTVVKEVRLSANIEKHDLEVKANQAVKFLKNGDKVKVTLRFRGRELSNINLNKAVIDEFKELLIEYSTVEKEAKLEGKQMIMVLAPKNS
ncbi:translation initiation factor 3 (bIF-3) [Serpentinicella alkaliphila]|uniref:Translation initiation factor IF-3 n=1 Tax=Serpentinicella alkaliphila TaxID=1734049 RepID=A0A4V6NSG8_9FIRM|nr:translation initiation factor 3 (bIF-3) [Serpentinicella alkaliphila]